MDNRAAQQRIGQIRQQIVQEIDDKDQKQEYTQLWAGFYKKTLQQRLDQLSKIQNVNVEHFKDGGLSLQNANLMVENCIGKIGIPLGLGLNFLINGQYYIIPMAIEEPSVIAAASAAAKTIAECGNGFETYSTRPVMMGQMQLLNVENYSKAECLIDSNKVSIINRGNQACANMVKRGGGIEDVKLRQLGEGQASVDIFINVCDSMGANIVNTVLEHLAPLIEEITGNQIGIKILTNLCLNRKVTSLFRLNIEKMNYKNYTGQQVAQMILNAYKFAELDYFRAVTHNKGILNGIEAVCNATGQDGRAVNASLHGYACLNGKYMPLSKYSIEGNEFVGELTIPISVGTQGGVISQNPLYQAVLQILEYPDSQKLAEIMACVGLAQNFAALRALTVEGIQKGHMSLHAKNIAISVGVPEHQVEDAVLFMKNRGSFRKETAKEFLKAYHLFQEIGKVKGKKNQSLCTFSAQFQLEGSQEKVELHVVFDCHSNKRIDVDFLSQQEISIKLFGSKSHVWFQNLFKIINIVKIEEQSESLPKKGLTVKLKVISILINLLSYNLLIIDYEKTRNYLNYVLNQQHIDFPDGEIEFKYGIALLTELLHIFEYNIQQFIGEQVLKNALLGEQNLIIKSHLNSFELWQKAKLDKEFQIGNFWLYRKKRLSCTMMLLCDCINFKIIDEKLVELMKQLGDVYEIEITLTRDTEKWKDTTLKDPNIYTYWLMQHDQLLQGDRNCVLDQFKNESSAMLEMKRQRIQPLLPSSMAHLSKQATTAVSLLYQSRF